MRGECPRQRVSRAKPRVAALERGTRIGHSKQDPIQFVTYYMVHDGHHRGQIMIQARLLGYPISSETMSGRVNVTVMATRSVSS